MSRIVGTFFQVIAGGLACVCASCWLPEALAQEEQAGLQALKREFEAQRAARLAPQLEAFVRKLAELERASVERRDYALAGRIQDALESAASDWSHATGVSREVLELEAEDAELAGGVRRNAGDSDDGGLAGWDSGKGSATWRLPPGVRGGAYAVTIEYRVGGPPVAAVLRGDRFRLRSELAPSADGSLQTQECKPLLLTANAATFSVALEHPVPPSAVVRKVRLTKLSRSGGQ